MTKQELSALIKRAREEKKLNQKDIADSLFYTTQTVSLWESGKSFPKMDAFFRFCQLLEIDINAFFKGTLKENKDCFEYDNRKSIRFFVSECKRMLIEKTELEQKLEVSRPKLQKIINGDYMLNLFQFSAFLDLLEITSEEVFDYKDDTAYITRTLLSSVKSIRFRKSLAFLLSFGILLGITTIGHLYLNESNDTPPVIKDDIETPPIPPENQFIPYIDYSEKCLCGFISGNSYTIQNQIIISESSQISIQEEWYNTELEITDNTLNITKSIFIDTSKFENYFPLDPTSIPNRNVDLIDFDTRIDSMNHLIQEEDFGSSDSNQIKRNLLLSDFDRETLKETFKKDIPYYADRYFSTSLFDEEESRDKQGIEVLNYQVIQDTNGKYVEIQGVKTGSVKSLLIPKTIDGIEDIRIQDKAFSKDKNPELCSIAFEAKPHYIGDFVFEGLNLKSLDFGIEENPDYTMDCNLKLKSNDAVKGPIYFSDCLKGIKHISKLRPPLNFSRKSYMTFKLLFGIVAPDKNPDFEGIDALFLPETKSSEPFDYFDYYNMNHCRIYSLYLPKKLKFHLDSTEKDLYLRAVRFEPGYQMEIKEEGSTKVYHKSRYDNSFMGYPALEYLLGEENDKTFSVSERFLNLCPFFQGEIQYSNISKLNKNCFKGTLLPTKITLSHVTEIKTGAFEGTYGLNELTIENKDGSELTVYPKSFVNSESVPESRRIRKITFIGFDDRLNLLNGYKDDSIEVEFLSSKA